MVNQIFYHNGSLSTSCPVKFSTSFYTINFSAGSLAAGFYLLTNSVQFLFQHLIHINEHVALCFGLRIRTDK
ncbi:Uncharacterised protein [Klebsiella variicola]|uniref:Uncharacterized protein n=1 Tax=Klebsiella variicola TaxID=244366 RepID=A0A7H4ME23_KLEVA|nr:Uncharacterised protein [Klebsiella variicola]